MTDEQDTESSKKLVDIRELARRLRSYGLSMRWLMAEAKAGRIPSLRAGHRFLFSVEAVEKNLLRRATGGDACGKDDAG